MSSKAKLQQRKQRKASRGSRPAQGLRTVREHVAGIDIGSREMYVCGPVQNDGDREIRMYATTTVQIQECAQWLKQMNVVSVAMESTGVYWIPVLEILEGCGLEVVLADTRPMSRVPARKSDVKDCEWIQTLHSHGLLQGSYRPAEQISELRMIVRQKAVLVAEQADWTRRMQKSLDQMNVRVHHAVSDAQGTTGMAILRAIVNGERDPHKLAEHRDPRCQKSKEQIAELLTGNWRTDHLFNLEQGLKVYDAIGERIETYQQEIQRRLRELTPAERKQQQAPPLANPEKRKAMKRRNQEGKRQELYRMAGVDLTTIDGIGVETAEIILSEYGADLSKFEDEHCYVSHLKLTPYKPTSGGKPLKKKSAGGKPKCTRTGQALRTAAVALRHSPTALGAYFRNLSRRKGDGVAIFSTARKLGTLVYRMLRWGKEYVDEGQQTYEERYQALRLRSLTTTAAQMGFELVKKETVSA